MPVTLSGSMAIQCNQNTVFECASTSTTMPSGIRLPSSGHLYWTNMGNPTANDGSIERANLDGSNVTHIVPPGGTFTPKQLQLDEKNRKLYWSDREGMRVMRANLDGSKIESLIDTSGGDARPGKEIKKWCVGIALDVEAGKVYWTQKGPDNAGEGRVNQTLCSASLLTLRR
jgi:hypothetical protein